MELTTEGAGASCKYLELKRLERRWSSWKMHLLFTPRVLFFGGLWRKVRNVDGREYRSLSSRDERTDPRNFMYVPNPMQSRTQPSIPKTTAPKTTGTPKKSLRKASTADIRAFLSELKTLPHSQRRLLCKMLRRAAAHAPRKVSVVRLADPHQTMKP